MADSVTLAMIGIVTGLLIAILASDINVNLFIPQPVYAQVAVSSVAPLVIRRAPRLETHVMRIYETELAQFTVEYAMKRGYSVVGVVYGPQKGVIDVRMARQR